MLNARSRGGVLLLYSATGAISFVAFFLAYHVWHADLRVPFSYVWYGDSIEPQLRQLLDGGWFYEPRLSAPFGQHSVSIAQLNGLKWGIRWVLVELTRNPFVAQNLFELLDPILSSLTFLYAATRLGLSYAAAIPCAILFGNLYMLYWRVLAGHSMQAAYWMTPLGCLALLWIARGIKLKSRDGVIFAAIAVLIGFESHYEVFFACFLALVAMLIGWVQLRSRRPLAAGAIFIGVVALSFLVDYSPTLVWKVTHHGSSYQYARLPVEAYLYALPIGQMILPNPDHRIHKLASIREHFDSVFPALVNENKSATLGFVGDIGLATLFLALIAQGVRSAPQTMRHAAILALAAVVLATYGGLGAIVNTFITPDIRAYNRISTWISFFCLLAVAQLLDALWRHLRERGLTRVFVAIAAAVAILGVLDQSPAHGPPYAESRQQFAVDERWMMQIAAAVPPKAAVLELPYVDDLESNEGLRQQLPFMLTENLRWSVGAFRGTREAGFESWLASLPPKHMIAVALLCGFDGVLVYHSGFSDRGAAIETALQSASGTSPVTGDDGTQSFFPIHDLAAAAYAADPNVGTPRGIAEAVSIFDRNAADRDESLKRIESAIGKRLDARAADAAAEGLRS